MEKWDLPEGWEWKTFPEICEVNSPRPRIQRNDDVLTSFVPMQAVDDVEGKIVDMQTRPFGDVRRGYTYFEENDILLAKITPSMENGKAAVARGLVGGFGFGTTEFHVFHPHKGVLSDWIFYYIRRKSFRMEAKAQFRGAVGQQRVPEDFLLSYPVSIPYPNDPPRSLETQHRIVIRLEALLAEVAEARKLQEQIIGDTNELPEAFLGEVFTIKDGWQPQAIGEFADVKGGKRLPKGQPFADGQTDFPYLRVVDFKEFSIDQGRLKYLTPETRERIKHYTISKDDVYISIAGTIGLVGTVPADLDGANLTENAAKLVIHPEYKHKVDNKFLAYYLASPLGKLQIQQGTKAAGQPKLALMRIETIEVPLPGIDIQQQVVNYIDSVRDEIREMQRAQQENSELIAQLEQSLLAQAFRGEL